jgi:hypothetical protein
MFAEIAMKQDPSKHLTLRAMSLGYAIASSERTARSLDTEEGYGESGGCPNTSAG